MNGQPAITIRKTRANWAEADGAWSWTCNNDNCQWADYGLPSLQAALDDACRHLVDDFDQHHGMVELRPAYSETEDRYTATCHCGYEAEEKTEAGAETSIEMHAHWLREELPTRTTA
ncbi:hypothetical protein ACIPWE_38540 [Streptomyces sp. NPDC090073]|uniref:hypothetical protein n=1 Tax=Streptomyces sp. NPDC090073 TaxID=3365936 RepID=UPI0038210ED1